MLYFVPSTAFSPCAGSTVFPSGPGNAIPNGQSYRQVWPAKEERTDRRFNAADKAVNDPKETPAIDFAAAFCLNAPVFSGAAASGADAAGDAK